MDLDKDARVARSGISAMLAADWWALGYVAASWICIAVMSFHLGLYSDDYWNLYEAERLGGWAYFTHHLSHINNRYTYALINKLLHTLFYDPENLFRPLYIRSGRILVLTCHFSGVWLTYRTLVRLGVSRHALLCMLPFISFALYGDQALFWPAAAFAYPIGFFLFSGGIYCLVSNRPQLFALLTFFALGSTEFVILPSLTAAIVCGIATNRQPHRINKLERARGALILLSPFAAWALLVMITPAAALREARIHGHPKLFVSPVAWPVSYVAVYLRQLQPAQWMREYWLIAPAAAATAVLLMKDHCAKRLALLLILLFAASIFPLAAVGYSFYPVSHARLWYFPGLFFYIACFSIFGLLLRRFNNVVSARLHRWSMVGTAVCITTASLCFAVETYTICRRGEEAFGCVQGMLETVRWEAKDRIPQKVEVCGLPPALHNFSIFQSAYSGPYALSLLFNTDKTVPFSARLNCPPKWGRPWSEGRCPAEARYKILYP